MGRLTTLKPRLKTLAPRLTAAAPTAAVQRLRGKAGVQDRAKIKTRDKNLCQQCLADGETTLGVVVDHKVPLWEGGSDEPSNKWLLCDRHHDAKTAIEAARRAGRIG